MSSACKDRSIKAAPNSFAVNYEAQKNKDLTLMERLRTAFTLTIIRGNANGYANAMLKFQILQYPWYARSFPEEKHVDLARGGRVIPSYFK